jgi:hypothetical protein
MPSVEPARVAWAVVVSPLESREGAQQATSPIHIAFGEGDVRCRLDPASASP